MVEIKVEILFGDFLHFELEIQHLLLGLEEKLVFVCIGDADSSVLKVTLTLPIRS